MVTLEKIEVIAPPLYSEKVLHQFVSNHSRWIINTRERLLQKKSLEISPPIPCKQGSNIPLNGVHHQLVIQSSLTKRIKIEFCGEFIARVPDSINKESVSELIRDALINWMKKHAKLRVEQIIAHYSPIKNLYPTSFTIRSQKTRWGSCGPNNGISINWVLVMAPSSVLEYVVIHELCHLAIKNHSRQFWDLVAFHMPDYKVHRRWLKDNGFIILNALSTA